MLERVIRFRVRFDQHRSVTIINLFPEPIKIVPNSGITNFNRFVNVATFVVILFLEIHFFSINCIKLAKWNKRSKKQKKLSPQKYSPVICCEQARNCVDPNRIISISMFDFIGVHKRVHDIRFESTQMTAHTHKNYARFCMSITFRNIIENFLFLFSEIKQVLTLCGDTTKLIIIVKVLRDQTLNEVEKKWPTTNNRLILHILQMHMSLRRFMPKVNFQRMDFAN